jgi:hypothetical protein
MYLLSALDDVCEKWMLLLLHKNVISRNDQVMIDYPFHINFILFSRTISVLPRGTLFTVAPSTLPSRTIACILSKGKSKAPGTIWRAIKNLSQPPNAAQMRTESAKGE